MHINELETQLNVLKNNLSNLRKERNTLTKDVDTKITELANEERKILIQYQEEIKRIKKIKKNSISNMNLVFYWDNGRKFDTRDKQGMHIFKDLVFSFGLPSSYEARG
jgi:hypothetical protein